MRRMHERSTKASFSFSSGPHAPVNMVDSLEQLNVGGNDTFAVHDCETRLLWSALSEKRNKQLEMTLFLCLISLQ